MRARDPVGPGRRGGRVVRVAAALFGAGLVVGGVPELSPAVTEGAAQDAGGPMERVRSAPDGEVRMRFETREGMLVCDDGSVSLHEGSWAYSRSGQRDRRCESGEAQVVLDVRDGRIRNLGPVEMSDPDFRGTDLGLVDGARAGTFFLELVRSARGRVAERAVFPAVAARHAEAWRDLLEVARDRERPSDVRKDVVFWVGQEAATVATEGLKELASDDSEDDEVRAAAVFALSQRPRDEGVPALVDLVRSSESPRVRKKALFWLAQSGDDRALALFEEILAGRNGGG